MTQDLRSAIALLPWFAIAAALVGCGYILQQWQNARAENATSKDPQVGIKITLYALLMCSVGSAAVGVTHILHYLLSGASDTISIKPALAMTLTGMITFVGNFIWLLPRTNRISFPQIERYATGGVALVAGFHGFVATYGVFLALFRGFSPWTIASGTIASAIVMTSIAIVAVQYLGQLSGWVQFGSQPASTPNTQQIPLGGQAGYVSPPPGIPGGGGPPMGGPPPPV